MTPISGRNASFQITPAHHVRWMIRRDMAEVIQICRIAGGIVWDEAEFLTVLRMRNCIGSVCERGERVDGFMVYELCKGAKLSVLNFAVHPEWQRSGCGTAMADKLKSKLRGFHRTRIVADVPGDKLSMQLFLRSQGFRAVAVVGDIYRMTYSIE